MKEWAGEEGRHVLWQREEGDRVLSSVFLSLLALRALETRLVLTLLLQNIQNTCYITIFLNATLKQLINDSFKTKHKYN